MKPSKNIGCLLRNNLLAKKNKPRQEMDHLTKAMVLFFLVSNNFTSSSLSPDLQKMMNKNLVLQNILIIGALYNILHDSVVERKQLIVDILITFVLYKLIMMLGPAMVLITMGMCFAEKIALPYVNDEKLLQTILHSSVALIVTTGLLVRIASGKLSLLQVVTLDTRGKHYPDSGERHIEGRSMTSGE